MATKKKTYPPILVENPILTIADAYGNLGTIELCSLSIFRDAFPIGLSKWVPMAPIINFEVASRKTLLWDFQMLKNLHCVEKSTFSLKIADTRAGFVGCLRMSDFYECQGRIDLVGEFDLKKIPKPRKK